jgi:hypothetical protein
VVEPVGSRQAQPPKILSSGCGVRSTPERKHGAGRCGRDGRSRRRCHRCRHCRTRRTFHRCWRTRRPCCRRLRLRLRSAGHPYGCLHRRRLRPAGLLPDGRCAVRPRKPGGPRKPDDRCRRGERGRCGLRVNRCVRPNRGRPMHGHLPRGRHCGGWKQRCRGHGRCGGQPLRQWRGPRSARQPGRTLHGLPCGLQKQLPGARHAERQCVSARRKPCRVRHVRRVPPCVGAAWRRARLRSALAPVEVPPP